MALARPLSGSGSLGILADVKKQYGVNSDITAICATIFASSETTFYVIAVYFGAVGIRRTRHAVATGLVADIAGDGGQSFARFGRLRVLNRAHEHKAPSQ